MSEIKLINGKSIIFKRDTTGDLQNAYTPLLNLIDNKNILGDFTTTELKYDRYTPIDMVITDEYDGSLNIIINDDINSPKLINSGFSVQENNTFNIPEHSGNAVTNIYEEDSFEKDSQLLKLYSNIPSLKFKGIHQGGSFKCGSYVFYFKLADANGNLSNIVLESGIVQMHIGVPNSKKVRMGLQDENSDKSIKFTLSDIDRGFDYVKVFYERRSSDFSQAIINTYYMISQNFPIRNGLCDILLTGEEDTIEIDKSELNTKFADIQSAKTQTIVDNTLFLGNISLYLENYQELLQMSWRIIPTVVTDSYLGSISSQTNDLEGTKAYYNVENVYNNTGYWADEFYRFGIVYIFENNLLSPVFNILGADLSKSVLPELYFLKEDITGKKYAHILEPDNFIFKKDHFFNSKGVIRFPSKKLFKCLGGGSVSPVSIKIEFDFKHIADEYYKEEGSNYLELKLFLNKNHIKGFFFVRQKRIPTIIALGMVVGLTGRYFGSIPVLKDNKDNYITKSFLSNGRLLLKQGSTVRVTSDVLNKALLVPDYDVNEPALNQIFTGLEFLLTKAYNCNYQIKGDHHFVQRITYNEDPLVVNDVKLTAVPKGTRTKTDGTNYFSSLAGNENEPYKTEDVNNRWNTTPPLNLTASTSLIRGKWGSYVGMSTDRFEYGDVVNIKLNDFKDSELILLEFEKRFKDYSLYSAISPRYNIDEICSTFTSNTIIRCSRGDCYPSVFTHRIMTNFIDPELPTNLKIIDPACWAKNYAVRCTAEILQSTHSNLTQDSAGWYIPAPINKTSSILSIIFGILTGNVGLIANSISNLNLDSIDSLDKYANEVAEAFEIYMGDGLEKTPADTSTADDGTVSTTTNLSTLIAAGHIKKVNPKEQELLGGFNLKAIFKSDDKWELHGLSQINRADVNAVSFGSWITFPICSTYNLAFRDLDFTNAIEESTMNKKRSFYPWDDMNPYDHMLESGLINGACKTSLSSNLNPGYTTIPYIKQEYFNRIYWSKPNVSESFINSYRMIFDNQYREYNKEFGAITKLVPFGNSLMVIFLHGIGMLPVNRNPQTTAELSPYLSSRGVLPSQVLTLSKDYGSMWKDSILQSPYTNFIYGVDTVAKKIWKIAPNGAGMEFISDHKINKFLNEWIDLSEYDFKEYQGHVNVKTHYNAFKHDIMFTYYKDIPIYKKDLILPLGYSEDKYTIGTNNIVYKKDGTPVTKTNLVYKFKRKELIFKLTSSCYAYFKDAQWYAIDVNTGKETPATLEDFVFVLDGTDQDCLNYYNLLCTSPISKNFIDESSEGYLCTLNSEYSEKINNYVKAEETTYIESWKTGKTWSLCYNEETQKWTTFYDWYPVESCNIDNIFFSFDKEALDSIYNNNNPDLIISVGDSFYKTNKVFIDKAFTENTTVYICNNKVISLDVNKPHSFYYTGSIILNEDSLPKLYESSFGYDSQWKFVYIPKGFSSMTISGQISEFKEHAADTTPNIKDPILAYWDQRSSENNKMYLWKHGLAGIYDCLGRIKPTNWYGKLHEFNFEFVVAESPLVLKIFNNLKIISNKTAPNKLEYEIVGEGYDWHKYKPIIEWINNNSSSKIEFEELYKYVLSTPYNTIILEHPTFPLMWEWEDKLIKKIPFIHLETCDRKGRQDKSYWKRADNPDYWSLLTPDLLKDYKFTYNCSETTIVTDELLNEQRIHTELLGNNMNQYGRLRGNMLYLEDLWDIEIRPINVKWAYLNNNTLLFLNTETKHRDKYLKIKVRYSGENLAFIQGIISMFDVSFA